MKKVALFLEVGGASIGSGRGLSHSFQVLYERQQWTYQQAPQFQPTIAGYAKAWSENLVQLTVKVSAAIL